MGLFTKDIKTMNDLFVHQLQDVYYAEKQLVKALPKMAEKATDKQLKQGFLTHLNETRTHVQRLEEIFRMHGAEVKAADCPAIDGIIEEADDVSAKLGLARFVSAQNMYNLLNREPEQDILPACERRAAATASPRAAG